MIAEQFRETADRITTQRAEFEVLGRCIMWPELCCAKSISRLVRDDFCADRGWLFQAIANVFARGVSPEATSLAIELETIADWPVAKTGALCIDATDTVASSKNLDFYTDIVLERSRNRQILAATNDVQKLIADGATPPEVMAEAQARLLRVELTHGGLEHIGPAIAKVYAEIEAAHDNKGQTRLVYTGISKLDEAIGGFAPQELIILAGRPGSGKSAFAMQIAEYVAGTKRAVAFFSLEMSTGDLLRRMLAAHTLVKVSALRSGAVHVDDWGPMAQVVGRAETTPLYINDRSHQTIDEIRANAQHLRLTEDLALVVIDYLGLIRNPGRYQNRNEEIAWLTGELKQLAKELECPVIALSQLNREVDKRTSHVPQLSDLRDSGQSEANADAVLFVHREFVFDTKANPREAVIYCRKSRNNNQFELPLRFDPERTRFEDN